jgi:hypothetical protein
MRYLFAQKRFVSGTYFDRAHVMMGRRDGSKEIVFKSKCVKLSFNRGIHVCSHLGDSLRDSHGTSVEQN